MLNFAFTEFSEVRMQHLLPTGRAAALWTPPGPTTFLEPDRAEASLAKLDLLHEDLLERLRNYSRPAVEDFSSGGVYKGYVGRIIGELPS